MSYATEPHIVRPRMVSKHLRSAALADSAACMTSSYLRIPGSIDCSEESSDLRFVGRDITLSRVARVEPGQSVRIDYRFDAESLVFFSRVMESPEPGSWLLSYPRAVQRLSRRGNDRQALPESAGVRLAMMTNHGLQSYPLVDLSSGGAAVRYNANEIGLWVGRRVTVWLETGSIKGVPVTVEVRHISRGGCGPGHKIAGVRFVDPGRDVRHAVDQLLFDK